MNLKTAVTLISAAVCLLAGQAVFAQRVPGPEGSKMELKWPDFKITKDSASPSKQPQPFYVQGREGRMMDLSKLTESILQHRALEAKKQEVKKQAAKPKQTKKDSVVPFYLMGREGHMMQLGNTVNSLKEKRQEVKEDKKEEKKQPAKPQPKKEKSVIERLSEPGRLQAL